MLPLFSWLPGIHRFRPTTQLLVRSKLASPPSAGRVQCMSTSREWMRGHGWTTNATLEIRWLLLVGGVGHTHGRSSFEQLHHLFKKKLVSRPEVQKLKL